ALVEVGVELSERDRGASENDGYANLFTQVGIGQRKSRSRPDSRVIKQLFFDVRRGDRFTGAADDVFDPAGDHQVAVVPEAHHVAAAVKPVGSKAALVVLRRPEVSVEGIGSANQ